MATQSILGPRRLFRRTVGAALRSGIDLLFPPSCVQCRVGLPNALDAIQMCIKCRADMAPDLGPCCRRCGAPVFVAEHSEASCGPEAGCQRCRDQRLAFDAVQPLGVYEGLLREAVLRQKRWTGESTAIALAGLLWRRFGEKIAEERAEVIVPVPMHWTRRIRRGASGPEVVAELLARRLGVPSASRLVVRRRNTLPQFGLPPKQRFKNVRGAFRISAGYNLCAERVLLVDDILTTGATCHEVAKALRAAGAKHVSVAVLARAVGG